MLSSGHFINSALDRLSAKARIRLISLFLLAAVTGAHVAAITLYQLIKGTPIDPDALRYFGAGLVLGAVIIQLILSVLLRSNVPNHISILAVCAGMPLQSALMTLLWAGLWSEEGITLNRVIMATVFELVTSTMFTFGLTVSILLLMINRQRVAQARAAADELERVMTETRLSYLQSQMNPHFLFNALNTISALIGLERSDDARKAVIALGDSLNGDAAPLAPLGEEIESTQTYLAIEALRFPDRLDVRWQVQPGLEARNVPRFSLQPLVENVIKHAVSETEARIEARIEIGLRQGGKMEICVCNSGYDPAHSADRNGTDRGIGLSNLRQRAEILFTPAARLESGATGDGEFRACLILPAQTDTSA